MRNKRRTLIFALLFLLISIAAWQIFRPRPQEPVYEGKTLTEWLKGFASWDPDTPSPGTKALLSMGTNTLPFLIADLRAHDSALESKFYIFLARRSLLPAHFLPAHDRRHRACKALLVLGPLAKPAIPALADCLDNPDTAEDAVEVLGFYGSGGKPRLSPEATPALLKALTNSNPNVRRTAANSLGLSQTLPEVVVPALIHALKDPDLEVRRMAASSFGGIYKKESTKIVSALIETLDDPDWSVRKRAIWMLGRYGPSAKDAVPKLLNLLKDAPPDLEREIRTALRDIDPAAAQSVGK